MTENPYWAERAADLDFKTLREAIEEALWNPFQDAHLATFKEMQRRRNTVDRRHTAGTSQTAKRIEQIIKASRPSMQDEITEAAWNPAQDPTKRSFKATIAEAGASDPSSDPARSWDIWSTEAAVKLILAAVTKAYPE